MEANSIPIGLAESWIPCFLIEHMPNDILFNNILQYLDVHALLNLFLVAKSWKSRFSCAWKQMCAIVWNFAKIHDHYWYWLEDDYHSLYLKSLFKSPKTITGGFDQLSDLENELHSFESSHNRWWKFVFFHFCEVWADNLNAMKEYQNDQHPCARLASRVAMKIMYHYPMMGDIGYSFFPSHGSEYAVKLNRLKTMLDGYAHFLGRNIWEVRKRKP